MSSFPFIRNNLIYVNKDSHVSVYHGFLTNRPGSSVAIKEELFSTLPQANLAIQEAMSMVSLCHPHIVTIYDCQLEEADGGWLKSVIVMELMESDVEKEVRRRGAKRQPWADWELIKMLREVVGALRYAEERGISHRDIKPQNLFLNPGSSVKIGDFGSSARNLFFTQTCESVHGTPFFLSPELKLNYLQYIKDNSFQAKYDPIKSDVYSLGLTMVNMALLETPTKLGKLERLEEEVERCVHGMPQYPHLQPMLEWMLKVQPETRPTFVEMDEYFRGLQGYYDQLCRGEDPRIRSLPVQWAYAEEAKREIPADPQPEDSECQEAIRPVSVAVPQANEPDEPQYYSYLPQDVGFQPFQYQCQKCSILLPHARCGAMLCEQCEQCDQHHDAIDSICVVCQCPILAPIQSIPEDLKSISDCAAWCCSVSCMHQLVLELERPVGKKCVFGDHECSPDSQVMMPCGHAFHSKDCLHLFVLQVKKDSTIPNPDYCCPQCGHKFKYKKDIEKKIGKKNLKESLGICCSVCLSFEVFTSNETGEVWYCQKHTPKKELARTKRLARFDRRK